MKDGLFLACMDCMDWLTTLREVKKLEAAQVRLYNAGYRAGHHDTVEGQYIDILDVDMDTYHADVVAEINGESA